MIEIIETFIKSKTFAIAIYTCTMLVIQHFTNFEFAAFIGISTIVCNLEK
jgi:hypothetical protein